MSAHIDTFMTTPARNHGAAGSYETARREPDTDRQDRTSYKDVAAETERQRDAVANEKNDAANEARTKSAAEKTSAATEAFEKTLAGTARETQEKPAQADASSGKTVSTHQATQDSSEAAGSTGLATAQQAKSANKGTDTEGSKDETHGAAVSSLAKSITGGDVSAETLVTDGSTAPAADGAESADVSASKGQTIAALAQTNSSDAASDSSTNGKESNAAHSASGEPLDETTRTTSGVTSAATATEIGTNNATQSAATDADALGSAGDLKAPTEGSAATADPAITVIKSPTLSGDGEKTEAAAGTETDAKALAGSQAVEDDGVSTQSDETENLEAAATTGMAASDLDGQDTASDSVGLAPAETEDASPVTGEAASQEEGAQASDPLATPASAQAGDQAGDQASLNGAEGAAAQQSAAAQTAANPAATKASDAAQPQMAEQAAAHNPLAARTQTPDAEARSAQNINGAANQGNDAQANTSKPGGIGSNESGQVSDDEARSLFAEQKAKAKVNPATQTASSNANAAASAQSNKAGAQGTAQAAQNPLGTQAAAMATPPQAPLMPETIEVQTATGTARMEVDPATGALHMTSSTDARPSAGNVSEVALTFTRARMLQVPAKEMAFEIARHVSQDKNHFEIRVNPPELGRIDVRMEIGDHGRVQAHLMADKQDTLDLLQRDRGLLERALSDAGLDVGQNALSFQMRGENANGGFEGQTSHGRAGEVSEGVIAELQGKGLAEEASPQVSQYGFDVVRMKRLDVRV